MASAFNNLLIQQIGLSELERYARVPARFLVELILDIEPLEAGLGGFRLVERSVDQPYVKDYDGGAEGGPASWSRLFDTSKWGFLLAAEDGSPVGGAAVAAGAAIYPLDRFQRKDLAVLWDLRVHPERRGQGIGGQLFRRAAEWARGAGYGQLGMETQNVNVPACRFYLAQGCQLGAVHRFGYAGCPGVADEAMLLFVFYPAWPVSFWRLVTLGMSTARETPTIPGLHVVAGELTWGKWIWIAGLFIAIVAYWRRGQGWGRRSLMDISILGGMMIAPVGWSYDQVMLLFPLLRLLEWVANSALARKDAIIVVMALIIINAITFYVRVLTPSEVWYFWVLLVVAIVYAFAWQRRQAKPLAVESKAA